MSSIISKESASLYQIAKSVVKEIKLFFNLFNSEIIPTFFNTAHKFT